MRIIKYKKYNDRRFKQKLLSWRRNVGRGHNTAESRMCGGIVSHHNRGNRREEEWNNESVGREDGREFERMKVTGVDDNVIAERFAEWYAV